MGFVMHSNVAWHGFIIDGDQTADGSGDGVFNIVAGADDEDTANWDIIIFIEQKLGTTEWPISLDVHVAGAINPTSDSNADAVGYMLRAPIAGSSTSCLVDGVHDLGYTKADVRLSLKSLGASFVLRPGDYLTNAAGTVWHGVVLNNVTASGAGAATVEFGLQAAWNPADETAVELVRPAIFAANQRADTSRIILSCPKAGARYDDEYIMSRTVGVRVQTGWVMRGLVKYTYINLNSSTLSPGYEPQVVILNDTPAVVATTTDTGRQFVGETEMNPVTMTVDYTPTVTDQYAVGFRPPGYNLVEPVQSMWYGYYALLDWSLSYAPQGYSMTGVAYSSANAAFMACNRKLIEHGYLPRVFTVSLRDLAYDDRFVMADEKLTLGGDVRLLSTRLGLDQNVRVMRIVHDIIDPLNSQVTLGTEPLRVTKITPSQSGGAFRYVT